MAALSRIGLGCAPIGNLYSAVSEEQAAATVDAAWNAGVRLFDTAPQYGHGLSEQRLGRALARRPRDQFVLSSKVGRLLRAVSPRPPSSFADIGELDPVFDFSRDGVLRSIDESLERLGMDRLDIVHVHDPDDHEADALSDAFPALIELRDQGVIGAVGCGMNQTAMLTRFVERVDLDVILVAGRWTLLDQQAGETLLPLCLEHGVQVIVGGVFNSGLLANPSAGATYDYAPAAAPLVARAQAMADRCAEAGANLRSAAIAFAFTHPAVTTVLVGVRSPSEITDNVTVSAEPIPPGLLGELLLL